MAVVVHEPTCPSTICYSNPFNTQTDSKPPKGERKMPFGLILKSPKGNRENGAKRENGGRMSDFGGERVQRMLTGESGSDIVLEHGFQAQNDKSPGNHISEALVRENLCIRLFGGGNVTSTTSVREILSSPKGRDNYCTTSVRDSRTHPDSGRLWVW